MLFVMGVVFFVMVEFFGVLYLYVMLVAVILVIFYYGVLFVVIYFNVGRAGLCGFLKSELSNLVELLWL